VNDLHGFVGHWGYVAIFVVVVLGNVGLPVPEETILALAGYLVWRGKLRLSFVLAVGAIAEAKVLGGQRVIPVTHDIEIAFTYAQNWPLGAALAVLLMLVVGTLVLLVLRRFDLDLILGRR